MTSKELKQFVSSCRLHRQRLRAISKELKQYQSVKGWSDIVILSSIVEALIELNLPYSKDEFYSAFKLVSKDDYNQQERKFIFKQLLRKAENRSIF